MEAKLFAVFSAGLDLDVSAVCRQLGISRQTFYKYRRRWAEEGPPGLVERSRRPRTSPNQVPVEVEDLIVRFRKELVVDNGAKAIAFHLGRRLEPDAVPSVATIHRVLVRRGLVIAQPDKRPRSSWHRFEWPRPNDAWQIDATCWALASGREVWIMDVLDDHSRVLVAARVAGGPTAAAAWEAFSHGVTEWGLPAHVMSDNGSCFTGRFHGGEADFERQLRDLGIRHILSSPGHPQTCGKLERSHQTTKRWLRTLNAPGTVEELQAQLDDWRHHYNHQRPHSAIRGLTPGERWNGSPPSQPGDSITGPSRASLHTVSASGKAGWGDHDIGIGAPLAGQTVLILATGDHLVVHGQTGHLRTLTLDRTRRYQPTGKPVGRPRRPNP